MKLNEALNEALTEEHQQHFLSCCHHSVTVRSWFLKHRHIFASHLYFLKRTKGIKVECQPTTFSSYCRGSRRTWRCLEKPASSRWQLTAMRANLQLACTKTTSDRAPVLGTSGNQRWCLHPRYRVIRQNWQPAMSPDLSLMSCVLAVIQMVQALLTTRSITNNKLLWKLSTRKTLPLVSPSSSMALVSGGGRLSVKQTWSPGLRWTVSTFRRCPARSSGRDALDCRGADGDSWLVVWELGHRTNHMPGFPSWQSCTQRHARTHGEKPLCWRHVWRHKHYVPRCLTFNYFWSLFIQSFFFSKSIQKYWNYYFFLCEFFFSWKVTIILANCPINLNCRPTAEGDSRPAYLKCYTMQS